MSTFLGVLIDKGCRCGSSSAISRTIIINNNRCPTITFPSVWVREAARLVRSVDSSPSFHLPPPPPSPASPLGDRLIRIYDYVTGGWSGGRMDGQVFDANGRGGSDRGREGGKGRG